MSDEADMGGQCEAQKVMGDTEWQCERDKGHDGSHGFCLDWFEFDEDDPCLGVTTTRHRSHKNG